MDNLRESLPVRVNLCNSCLLLLNAFGLLFCYAMKFEWDTGKAEVNLKKHKVAFAEASSVFADTLGITIYDPDHSKDEERYITIGHSHQGRTLLVAHTDRGDRIRIISARELTKTERKAYEEGK